MTLEGDFLKPKSFVCLINLFVLITTVVGTSYITFAENLSLHLGIGKADCFGNHECNLSLYYTYKSWITFYWLAIMLRFYLLYAQLQLVGKKISAFQFVCFGASTSVKDHLYWMVLYLPFLFTITSLYRLKIPAIGTSIFFITWAVVQSICSMVYVTRTPHKLRDRISVY